MRILLSPLCRQYCGYAKKLLKCFVTNLHGTKFLVNNTHNLFHLADDAEKYGPLDLVSCFMLFGTVEKNGEKTTVSCATNCQACV